MGSNQAYGSILIGHLLQLNDEKADDISSPSCRARTEVRFIVQTSARLAPETSLSNIQSSTSPQRRQPRETLGHDVQGVSSIPSRILASSCISTDLPILLTRIVSTNSSTLRPQTLSFHRVIHSSDQSFSHQPST